MITSVLVANRGEIARRIFRTCRALGISCVAVYSDADARAPFVAEADVAVRLPGNAPGETYLRADLLVDAALRAGADAVHPGYGFLSESASFARAVVDAGLVWIGPPASAIESMGSKILAKPLMASAAVPVLPELDPSSVGSSDLPVLVKASAGGGGRGMRVVRRVADLPAEVEAARSEAASAFGDGTVFCEPYIEAGRHLEVQVLADQFGTIWTVGERECSIQRRHQKVIEETPSPYVDPALRASLFDAARAASAAIGYVGAGTVEFLADSNGQFYFLETNTRLQVEHPITECTTGLDLVALQIAIASGSRLPPAPPPRSGHAIEARLYAEDPTRDWHPQTGTLHHFQIPLPTPHEVPHNPPTITRSDSLPNHPHRRDSSLDTPATPTSETPSDHRHRRDSSLDTPATPTSETPSDHRHRDADPLRAPADPRGTSVDPRGTSVDPRGGPADPLGTPVDPVGTSVDPRGGSVGPLGTSVDRAAAGSVVDGRAKPWVRVDAGVESGSVVGPHYDPMLAKVIAWAPTRSDATRLLATTLARSRIHGLVTNRDLLVRTLRHPAFLAGETDTAFFDRHGLASLAAPLAGTETEALSALAAALAEATANRETAPVLGRLPTGWRNLPSSPQHKRYTIIAPSAHHQPASPSGDQSAPQPTPSTSPSANQSASPPMPSASSSANQSASPPAPSASSSGDEGALPPVVFTAGDEGALRAGECVVSYRFDRTGLELEYVNVATYDINVGNQHRQPGVRVVEVVGETVVLEVDGVRRGFEVARYEGLVCVDSALGSVMLRPEPRFADPSAHTAAGSLLAPMPGTVIRVAVAEGERVIAGQPLLWLEAMKMEHTIAAPTDGVVTELAVTPGQQVDIDTVLAVVKEES